MRSKPAIHLICNAHLDPVWQWRWEEGAAEALATFGTAVDLLNEHPGLIFCHNEAVLYQWVERLDQALFREIRRLVKAGRWAVSGGWYLQPDVNLPGVESLIRQIAEGRVYFGEKFGSVPRVAYNFDSFGHGGGLPQVLKQAGYKMYIHMRPQEGELKLPSDLYRWRGVDGSEILTYRIAVGLYHTEYDNIDDRLSQGVERALSLGRDVPVFWGIGDHGGGATREDLARIDAFIAREKGVRIVHSTPDRLYAALRPAGKTAPIVEGDLQRVFTGCYTSLSRLKRAAVASLGNLVQAEALRAATWWAFDHDYPASELREAWKGHLFNDFHDILTGSCVEPAEKDAMELYGRVADDARRLKLDAAAAFNVGQAADFYIPLTILNTNTSVTFSPVEVEAMISHRPKWTGEWHLRLYSVDGREIPCQEEQPEALLPFNGWRRKVSFMADLPGVGAARYELRLHQGKPPIGSGDVPLIDIGQVLPIGSEISSSLDPEGVISFDSQSPEAKNPPTPPFKKGGKGGISEIRIRIDPVTGLLASLQAEERELLAGPAPCPLVVKDEGDSWGTECRSYREVEGSFESAGSPQVIESGPIRTITESILTFRKSRLVLRTIVYPTWPVLEFRLCILWNEERKRLKLAIPTVFRTAGLLCEIPGGAIVRHADGDEHVHGRWCLAEGEVGGTSLALGIAHAGLHGLDFKDGEIRLSVLRSAAYCHERNFKIEARPVRKFMDLGVHDIRFLVIAGAPDEIKRGLSGLADWLAAPPAVYAHLPIGIGSQSPKLKAAGTPARASSPRTADWKTEIVKVSPENIRLSALKRSSDGRALIVRLQETAGQPMKMRLTVNRLKSSPDPPVVFSSDFAAFEIRTIRIERSGACRNADLIDER